MKKIGNLKIKHKLIAIIISITLFILFIGFGIIIYHNQSTLRHSFMTETSTIANVFGNGLVSVLSFSTDIVKEGKDEIEKFTGEIPATKNIFVFGENDELLINWNRSNSDKIEIPPVPQTPIIEFRDKHLHVFRQIIHKNKKFGTLYLRVSTKELDSKIRNLLITMILMIVILLPLSLLLATKLQAIISKPILALGHATRKVSSEGNYSIRVQKMNNDEVGMLYDSFNDMMSQIQKRDTQRDRVENELKTTEFFLSSVMESMPSILITIEKDGIVTQWNKAAVQLTGIEPNQAKGKFLWDLLPAFEKYKEPISNVYRSQKTIQFYKESLKIKENTLYLNVTIFPLLDTQTPRFVFMINNVTEIESKEQQLRQSQKMETVGTLAGGLAHDFNNVLGGIIGTISLFKYKVSKKREVTQSEVEKYFNTIEDSANRASDMVQHLLSLTRKQELLFAPTDLNTIIKSTIKICKNTFDKSIEINAIFTKEPAITNVDATQIEQSLLNLCINAYHAMTLMRHEGEKFGGYLNITLEKIKTDKYTFHPPQQHNESRDEEFWRISVDDTGVGMNSKTLGKIFDPFFTTKKDGKGTGLGLAMVYNIITQHKGFIDVYSQEGIGTTFHIYLPVHSSVFLEKQNQPSEEIFMGEGLILVIDDEEIMRQTAKSILEECGYFVLLAENGEEGVQLYNTHKDEIKAVLLDMIMPKMSGKQAYIELAKINKDVKVLLASGFKQNGRIESIMELGVNGFIQKPYSLLKLANSLHQIIEGKDHKLAYIQPEP